MFPLHSTSLADYDLINLSFEKNFDN